MPQGLSSYSDFTRWRILGGDATAWSPYSGSAPDQLALNGLYYLAVGNASSAMSSWRKLCDNSCYRYDGPDQRYIYPASHIAMLREPYPFFHFFWDGRELGPSSL